MKNKLESAKSPEIILPDQFIVWLCRDLEPDAQRPLVEKIIKVLLPYKTHTMPMLLKIGVNRILSFKMRLSDIEKNCTDRVLRAICDGTLMVECVQHATTSLLCATLNIDSEMVAILWADDAVVMTSAVTELDPANAMG